MKNALPYLACVLGIVCARGAPASLQRGAAAGIRLTRSDAVPDRRRGKRASSASLSIASWNVAVVGEFDGCSTRSSVPNAELSLAAPPM